MTFLLIQLGQSILKQLPTDLVKDQHLAPCLCPAQRAGVPISKGGGLVGEHQEAHGYPMPEGPSEQLLSVKELRFLQRQLLPLVIGEEEVLPLIPLLIGHLRWSGCVCGGENKNRNKNQRPRQAMEQFPVRKLKFDIIWLSRAPQAVICSPAHSCFLAKITPSKVLFPK